MTTFASAGHAPLSTNLQGVISRALNPVHGLLTSLREDRPSRRSGHIRIVRAALAPPAYFRSNAPSSVQTTEDGCGAAFDRESAYWAAIGEAVERYSASIYWPDDLVEATAEYLGDRAIDLSPLIRIGRPEVEAFDPTTSRAWCRGRRVVSEDPVLVPAMLCFLGYRTRYAGEIIAQSDSTGLACGVSPDDATLRALCELIERDAFAANWSLSRRAPRIAWSQDDIASLKPAVQTTLGGTDRPVNLFYIAQSFGIHVVAAFTRGERGLFSLAAAAAPSIGRAVEKAVAELLQGWSAVNAFPELDTPLDLTDLKTPFDHLRFYLHPDRIAFVEDTFCGDETVSFADLKAADHPEMTAGDLAARLNAHGFDAVAIDQTTPDVAELGLSVARVVAPGLQPMVFGPHSTCVPDTRRLDQWRAIWNLATAPLNPNPHPFP